MKTYKCNKKSYEKDKNNDNNNDNNDNDNDNDKNKDKNNDDNDDKNNNDNKCKFENCNRIATYRKLKVGNCHLKDTKYEYCSYHRPKNSINKKFP